MTGKHDQIGSKWSDYHVSDDDVAEALKDTANQTSEDTQDTTAGLRAPKMAGSRPSSSGAGDFMVNWVKQREGRKVSKKGESRTQCTDLVHAAIEAARDRGYYVRPIAAGEWRTGNRWSDEPIDWRDARPGDVLQLQDWEQKSPSGGGLYASHHSALIIGANRDKIFTYDQNPSPVHKSEYVPAWRTKGALQAFRVGGR